MKRSLAAMAAVMALAMVAGCGSSDPLSSSPSSAAPTDAVVVGSANFPESQLLAEIYSQALVTKGVKVDKKLNIGARKVYLAALKDGSIDLIPEYTGNLLFELKPDATQTTQDDVYAALKAALPSDQSVLEKAPAEDKDGFVVTQATAQKYNAKSIADIAPKCGEITFGGFPEFAQRTYGVNGLAKNYNCTLRGFTPQTTGKLIVDGLNNGSIQAGDVFTTDPAIKANNFVVLEDPKNNFPAANIVPLIRTSKASDTVKKVLDAISAKLTTAGLLDLNVKLDGPDKPNPDVVAKEWLQANGLL
ncbi:MAG: ABC transporter substrate-binding protein [Pseudonocardiales bacterium]|nr:ABC transporter substrate-binding protein [Pseudonocardiales bacterium]